MRNPFKFGCLKPKTKDDDDSLLHYPGGGSSKASGLNGYANGNVGGASSTAWQTPPLGKGAMRHLPPYQVQHNGITTKSEPSAWTCREGHDAILNITVLHT